ncbi:MAG: DEAD/DEAH box helicase family protein, partial [Prevotella sp.]|nr:DEAD/DEAH box helicase family protein [Prevotella sp.]
VKKPNNRDGILAERERINKRMRNDKFRRFMNITQLMIFSNNQEYDNENRVPIQGAFYCCPSTSKAFFNVFREEEKNYIAGYPYLDVSEEVEKQILKHRNCVVIKNLPEYDTNKDVNTPTNRILTSMLSRERFLFLLRYGFAYVDKKVELEDGSKTTQLEKHIMRYQQLFASFAIRRKLELGVKSGIIWHTQGSGKTALAYYSVRSLIDFYAKKETAVKFYFIVDRLDLMEQAKDEFASRGLYVRSANSREELMADIHSIDLTENAEGRAEIMVVNIQKFELDHGEIKIESTYGTKLQRIFFIDEAHRGYNPKGSFLANLLEADKNSVKIALTGTPLLREERESWRVFGDYIDTYYYDKSIADGYTLKLMREPIETIYKEKLRSILDELTNVKIKKRDFVPDTIIENTSYLNALIDYIIEDFKKFRIEQDDDTVGAMIVCKTNPQARKLYDLWQKRYEKEDKQYAEIKMAADPMLEYGHYKPLISSLILHDEGDRDERKAYIDEFKKKQTVDILIVNRMLLTGFDAPRLKKLYLGRSLDGHDLLQALTRVNRPYKDFRYGYVVDFVNIKEKFEETNNRYLQELNRTADIAETGQTQTVGESIIVDKEQIMEQIDEIRSVLFNYTCDNLEEFRKEIDEIDNKENLYTLRSTLVNAKAIINQVRAFGDDILKLKINSLPHGTVPTLISEVTNRIERLNLLENNEHKADVSGIINVALSEIEFEFKKGIAEELQVRINNIREHCERVQAEFEANFDHVDEKYVNLADEFREYFRKRGYIPQNVQEAKESIDYMDVVMKKIREINHRNNILKKKYKGDERFARVHKRIQEENQKRERPIISKEEYRIADSLSQMKKEIDKQLYYNINIIANEENFRQDTLAMISSQLRDLGIESEISDRKFINNLIVGEYINQYNQIQSR